MAGYFTLYGDGAGDYAPLRDLTVTEVLELGKWLGVPKEILRKMVEEGDRDALLYAKRFGIGHTRL